MGTLLEDAPVTQETDGDGDDLVAHICNKDDVARAYVTGEAIEALCGKKWVPSRDPEGREVCEPCKWVLSRMVGL